MELKKLSKAKEIKIKQLRTKFDDKKIKIKY
jgi:hypothetical protein